MKESIRMAIDELIGEIDNNTTLSDEEMSEVILELNKVWLKVYHSTPLE